MYKLLTLKDWNYLIKGIVCIYLWTYLLRRFLPYQSFNPAAAIATKRESKPTETQATTMSDFALPDNVKEVISRLPVRDQGEHTIEHFKICGSF